MKVYLVYVLADAESQFDKMFVLTEIRGSEKIAKIRADSYRRIFPEGIVRVECKDVTVDLDKDGFSVKTYRADKLSDVGGKDLGEITAGTLKNARK